MTKTDQDREETAGGLLGRLKDDGDAWAAEFRKTALALGYSDMDEGWLIGWFANAIENAEVVQRKRWEDANERTCAQGDPVAWRDVLSERHRQVSTEGWTPEHDDQHGDGSLALAAACYAEGQSGRSRVEVITDDVSGGRGEGPLWRSRKVLIPVMWPQSWDARWWKPSLDRRRNLVKAGALILAEIERLDRRALAHELARAASPAPQVPDGSMWVRVPRWPTYDQMAKLAVEWGYTVEEAGGVYDVILDICGEELHPAPVASHEPASVSEEDDVLEALKEVLGLLRKEAPGTPLNNHRFDDIGIRANAAVERAEMRRSRAIAAPPPEPPEPPEPAKAEVVAPFGYYKERDDGAREFRRAGEMFSPHACGCLIWALYATPPTAPAVHHDDLAVDRFATAMKAKLASKRALGYGGWDDPARCSNEHLSQLLHGHVGKGDPVDVANFAMMLHQRGERILSAPTAPAAARSAAEEVQHECVCGHRWKAPMNPDQNCPACNPGEGA